MKKLRDELMLFSRAAKKESTLSRDWVKRLDLDDFEDREFLRKAAKRLAKAANNWQRLSHEFNKKAAIGRANVLPPPELNGSEEKLDAERSNSGQQH